MGRKEKLNKNKSKDIQWWYGVSTTSKFDKHSFFSIPAWMRSWKQQDCESDKAARHKSNHIYFFLWIEFDAGDASKWRHHITLCSGELKPLGQKDCSCRVLFGTPRVPTLFKIWRSQSGLRLASLNTNGAYTHWSSNSCELGVVLVNREMVKLADANDSITWREKCKQASAVCLKVAPSTDWPTTSLVGLTD